MSSASAATAAADCRSRFTADPPRSLQKFRSTRERPIGPYAFLPYGSFEPGSPFGSRALVIPIADAALFAGSERRGGKRFEGVGSRYAALPRVPGGPCLRGLDASRPCRARYFLFPFVALFSSTAACAAASRAIGTRKGEALT